MTSAASVKEIDSLADPTAGEVRRALRNNTTKFFVGPRDPADARVPRAGATGPVV
jgi:hypothetical protein